MVERFFEHDVRPILHTPREGRLFLVGAMQRVIERFGVDVVGPIFNSSKPSKKKMNPFLRELMVDLENVVRRAELAAPRHTH